MSNMSDYAYLSTRSHYGCCHCSGITTLGSMSIQETTSEAWRDDGLKLSTTSNEAAKIFDLALHQYVGWYEDAKTGGIQGALTKLHQADPNFVLGKVFTYGIELLSTDKSLRTDHEFRAKIEYLQKEVQDNGHISDWEKMHAKAVGEWASGRMFEATKTWEGILVDYPRDIMALKMANDTYFYLGKSQLIRDSIARVIPEYKTSSSYYGYVKGMHAFGLEETNFYRAAEKSALEALDYNKQDAWASHALTHVFEMEARLKEGENFLSITQKDWTVCGFLACHLFWHWCLFLIEEGRYDDVLQLYDNKMHDRACSSKTMLDIVDTTSLLYRLQLEGVDVGDRWQDIYEICRPHMDNHVSAFNDAHILLSMCGLKRPDLIEKHSKSLRDYIENSDDDNTIVCRQWGLNVYEAIKAYSSGDYDRTIELMTPIRHDIIGVGGSHAQRDLFHQIMIHAALKSPKRQHWNLARSLLHERKALKPDSPLTDRLMSKLLSSHEASE